MLHSHTATDAAAAAKTAVYAGNTAALAALIGDPAPSHVSAAGLLRSWWASTAQTEFPTQLFVPPARDTKFSPAVLQELLTPTHGGDSHFDLYDGAAFQCLLGMAADGVGVVVLARSVYQLTHPQPVGHNPKGDAIFWQALPAIGAIAAANTTVRDALIVLGKLHSQDKQGTKIARILGVQKKDLSTVRTSQEETFEARRVKHRAAIDRAVDNLRKQANTPESCADAWEALLNTAQRGGVPFAILDDAHLARRLCASVELLARRFMQREDITGLTLWSESLAALFLRHPALHETIQTSLSPACLDAEMWLAHLRENADTHDLALTVQRLQAILRGEISSI